MGIHRALYSDLGTSPGLNLSTTPAALESVGLTADFSALRASAVAERLAGACLFAVACPIIAASAIATTVLSRRSPFVAHLRVGQFGAPLWVLKLRTMWPEADPRSAPGNWVERIVAEPQNDKKDPHDRRVNSRFAAFCRKHSIDELPQLWHVVRGEMSLVGPRPLTKSELVRHYSEQCQDVLAVKPGLTGLWQTQGRSTLDWPERVALDVELARKATLKRYATVLLRTIPALLYGNGAW